jgi:hypothetical protein
MVLFDRSEVRQILLEVYLLFKIHFSIEFFQNGVRQGALLHWIYRRRRISRRAVFAPAVFDFALREIKHGD